MLVLEIAGMPFAFDDCAGGDPPTKLPVLVGSPSL